MESLACGSKSDTGRYTLNMHIAAQSKYSPMQQHLRHAAVARRSKFLYARQSEGNIVEQREMPPMLGRYRLGFEFGNTLGMVTCWGSKVPIDEDGAQDRL